MIDKSEKFSWLVRLGYAARGVVYTLLGYLLLSAGGRSGEGGPSAAFAWIKEVPVGELFLYLCALGLLAYALYRLSSLVFDVENYGTDTKGILHRIGHGASALAHFVLAYTAYQIASGDGSTGGGAKEAASTVLSVEFGGIVLGVIGMGFIGAAAAQAKKAYTGSFMNRISAAAPKFEKALGQAGFAARAVVYAVIGWSLVRSGFFSSSAEVKSLGEAVTALQDNEIIFNLVALGLLLFGIFSLLLARYRIIPDLDPDGRMPSLR